MILIHLGSIPLGTSAMTGPTGQVISRKNTFAQYDVTRGKPVLHEIGEELDTQTFDFFFSEEFCNPKEELRALERAFARKSPLPLLRSFGGFRGERYVVEALDITVQHTSPSGELVRVEASISLIEAPTPNLFSLLTSIARAVAPALAGAARNNPNVRR